MTIGYWTWFMSDKGDRNLAVKLGMQLIEFWDMLRLVVFKRRIYELWSWIMKFVKLWVMDGKLREMQMRFFSDI